MEFDATFLIAAISFIVFVLIMNKIFYAPVLKIIKSRQQYVEDNFRSAETTDIETKKQTDYRNEELSKIRTKVQTLIAEKNSELKKEASKEIAQYKEQSYTNIITERNNIKQSAIDAKEVLKDNIVDLAKCISVKLFGDDINSENINKSQISENENYE